MLSWREDAHMALREGGRLRKRWRYVGVFGEELMLCVGAAVVGPLPSGWWAIWDRRTGALRERTVFWRPGRVVDLQPGLVKVRDGDVEIDLNFEEQFGAAAHDTRLPHGSEGAWIWTRKQAALPCRGTVRVGGVTLAVDALAVIDDTAGYHERETAWRWSAGIGREAGGGVVGWNLVTGVNDPSSGSERAVWRAGTPSEVGPVRFEEDLSAVKFDEGGELRFESEAIRERHDDFGLLASDYVQPFGTFSGTLPGGTPLTEGYGVMEDHRARW